MNKSSPLKPTTRPKKPKKFQQRKEKRKEKRKGKGKEKTRLQSLDKQKKKKRNKTYSRPYSLVSMQSKPKSGSDSSNGTTIASNRVILAGML